MLTGVGRVNPIFSTSASKSGWLVDTSSRRKDIFGRLVPMAFGNAANRLRVRPTACRGTCDHLRLSRSSRSYRRCLLATQARRLSNGFKAEMIWGLRFTMPRAVVVGDGLHIDRAIKIKARNPRWLSSLPCRNAPGTEHHRRFGSTGYYCLLTRRARLSVRSSRDCPFPHEERSRPGSYPGRPANLRLDRKIRGLHR